jgi:hypothetical protein
MGQLIADRHEFRRRRRRAAARAAAILLSAALVGCNGPLPRVELDTAGVEARIDYTELAVVLKRSFVTDWQVQAERLVDPVKLGRVKAELDSTVSRLAVAGPTATPELLETRESRLAYWYNARTAWAMKLAMLSGFPERLRRAALEERAFPLDGRTMTLAAVDGILAAEEDWRAVAAAPSVRLDRARLPARPFSAADVRERVVSRFTDFVADEDRFEIDVAARAVRFPPVVWEMRQRIIEAHRRAYGAAGASLTSALLPYVSLPAALRLQNAIGYRCVPAAPRRAIARGE